MIRSRAELRSYIRADAKAREVPVSLRSFLVDPIFRFNCLLRATEYMVNSGAPVPLTLIAKFLYRRLSIRLGFSVPLNVFGPGLCIVHYGLLVVTPFAKVGRDCRIHAGVNIGGAAGFFSEVEAVENAPRIGDRCYIGPGAKIFGRTRIGNDCAIGANSVVNNLITGDSATIAGIPGGVVSHKGSSGLIRSEVFPEVKRECDGGGSSCVD